MKRRRRTYYLWIPLLLAGVAMFSMDTTYLPSHYHIPEQQEQQVVPQDPDTLPRYPVSKTTKEEYQDIIQVLPADLRDPENVKTTIEYDLKTGSYVFRTRLGEIDLGTPMTMTREEYLDYSFRESQRAFFRKKNEEAFTKEEENKFSLQDMQFELGAAERIFGPGGVRVKTQGSAELTLGIKRNKTDDPSLPVRNRTRTFFNFDENIQLNVQASVGNKINFDMNYNTQTQFDFDSKKLKLQYAGEEDEIIKYIEAGNVNMTTKNSLIRGGAALFGIKADLQFGKLRVNTILSQQESESKTVSAKGGVQTKPFEMKVDEIDENRHFYLSHYFFEHYDEAMSTLPAINSAVTIERIEVWVTNKRGNFDQARNIVAFADLGEYKKIYNTAFSQSSGNSEYPNNSANTMYRRLVDEYEGARNINTVTQVLGMDLDGGTEFEKIESARRLTESEYKLNKNLGYISLTSPLQADEVLGVAFQINVGGQVYQVGEFSTDNAQNTSECLFVKLLKGTTVSPGMPFWKLMMRNVYSLPNAYSLQKEKFRLDIMYQSDTTGTYVNYLPEGAIANQILLQVMNLDRLDMKQDPYRDGFFDYVEGYTVQSDVGRIIFPVAEPFGQHLREKIKDDRLADKYVYEELYDSTLTVARQIAEKNKYLFRGEFKASSAAEIDLGATNVARGSVRVTAGGALLSENVDYTVDYTSGRVRILNESIIASGTPISVSLENQSMYNMQRKTMMGIDLDYQFSKDFSVGATFMHMSEMPLTVKTTMGDESIKNSLWGFNTAFKTESQWLTNVFDKLPLLSLTKPSQISFNAEFAHLIAGHYENKYTGGYSYLDDFESTQSGYNLSNPYSWFLASTPYQDGESPLFPEAKYVNDVKYGNNRALAAWYYIDGLFTRRNSSLLPRHIGKEDLSNHYVRGVDVRELFPNREQGMSDASTLSVFNFAYYPNERGPYNLDADDVNPDGTLAFPEKRWGGIMRKMTDHSDFEAANIEYLEFWLLDPFIYSTDSEAGGDLYFNLGEISEDILKDEKKFFENGLPIENDPAMVALKVDSTVWGFVPRMQSTVYSFDNTSGAREKQDVGLNGLSTEQEQNYPTYIDFLTKLQQKLSPETYQAMLTDKFSPFNDPAGDNYHYFRGDDYDAMEASILTRYKRYNGTEGNSRESEGQMNSAAKTLPDIEDINQDNTLNENEKYFEYKVSLRPKDMQIGSNHITDIRETNPLLANGTREKVKWYLFKIPVKKYDRSVGSIRDFKAIRFMRMYMTGFREPTILRFGTFELVRGEWRTYEQDLARPGTSPSIKGLLEVTSVNIEENGDRKPVNYVLPPGITRMLDSSQPQLRQENEQALSLKVTNLAPQDALAIYKTTSYDLRQYKKLQLFTHAEAFINDHTGLQSGELSVFIRLGSDYKNNYYEYEVPLKLTPHDTYNTYNSVHQEAVWPTDNMLKVNLESLTQLKLDRNKKKREGEADISFQQVYSTFDPENTRNTMSIMGNPSLSEVKTIMIGIRNNSKEIKDAEIWVNELRLSEFNESGGWAANANLNIALSDLGTVNLSGRMETAGFGALDQSLMERRLDDYAQYNIAANVQLGKFFPEKAKVSIPLYYTYSKETISSKYNPLDQDVKLSEALDAVPTKAEKDSIKSYAQDMSVTKSIALNNITVGIKSKNPMPYDPANFSFGYSYSQNDKRNPETEYETTKDFRANFAYNYTPYAKPFKPFEKIKKVDGSTRYLKQLTINYLPSTISFQTAMMRNYYEIQLRDLNNALGENNIPVSFSQNFFWDRAFRLTWNLTGSLNFNFSSGTNARIIEPHVQVNKELNPDAYAVWKDSVMMSIRDFGSPMKYDQAFQATFNLPLQHIPALDWVTSSVAYNATYNWDRGATIQSSDVEIGNIIKNQRSIDAQGNFNMQSLYNKSNYLKRVNQRFTPQSRPQSAKPKAEPPKFTSAVQLSPDSAVIVEHKLMVKRVRVTAKREDGTTYRIDAKPLDKTRVRINNRDSIKVDLVVVPDPRQMDQLLLDVADHSARFVMMLRRFNFSYRINDGMMLPGFRPEIGDMFGQKQLGVLAPGLGFAFGDVRRSYIDEADERGWLVKNEKNVSSAMINSSKTFDMRANLEPIPGLRIDLNWNRVDTRSTEIQFMYDGMPEKLGGTFTMTTVALKSAFKNTGDASNGYASQTFDRFLSYRQQLADRLAGQYANTTYPNSGFISETGLGGHPYNPNYGAVGPNSTDVLIPAFIAAYTGKDVDKIDYSPFPSFASMVPNWRITYDGLINVIPALKKHFKSFQLSHQYRCTYNVGSYSSYMNWVDAGNGLGFTADVKTGNPIPTSPYSIATVTLTEAFSPLLGVDAQLLNNITGKLEMRRSRTLNLNVTSYQIVEALANEVVVGVGYKMVGFNKVLNMKPSQNFSNDLTVRLDFSYKKMQSLIRKIEEQLTQATNGNVAKAIQFSADYGISRALSIRAFYDMQINEPLVSNSSFPTTNSNYGIALKFSLAQ